MKTSDSITLVKNYLLSLQHQVCQTLEALDQYQIFHTDIWERPNGGGGVTKIMNKGHVFAKAGVNFSHVFGQQLPPSASLHRTDLVNTPFQALGVSIVIHPENPYVPTTHANVRFFLAEKDNTPVWWFGGGFDLTPYYGFEEDCEFWHQTALKACHPFGEDLYWKFKAWADRYFYIKHRAEARGIGGLFFDDFHEGGFENAFALMQSVGDHFMQAYTPIVLKRQNTPYGEREIAFQRYRRGRYVEFNLVYDRGTLFGLQSGGRTESILMSLPDIVHWEYNWQPEPGSAEEKLYKEFLPPRNWIR